MTSFVYYSQGLRLLPNHLAWVKRHACFHSFNKRVIKFIFRNQLLNWIVSPENVLQNLILDIHVKFIRVWRLLIHPTGEHFTTRYVVSVGNMKWRSISFHQWIGSEQSTLFFYSSPASLVVKCDGFQWWFLFIQFTSQTAHSVFPYNQREYIEGSRLFVWRLSSRGAWCLQRGAPPCGEYINYALFVWLIGVACWVR